MSKRESIIATAIRLFVTQGFDNTPTSQVSKEANVATGTLFHYFKTKEELINEAYLYVKKKIVEGVDIDEEKSVKEQLEHIWKSNTDWCFSYPLEVQFVFLFSNSVYITKLSKKEGEKVFEPIREVIRRGVKERVLKDLPSETIEQIYYNIAKSFLSSKKDKTFVYKGFDIFWDAVKR